MPTKFSPCAIAACMHHHNRKMRGCLLGCPVERTHPICEHSRRILYHRSSNLFRSRRSWGGQELLQTEPIHLRSQTAKRWVSVERDRPLFQDGLRAYCFGNHLLLFSTPTRSDRKYARWTSGDQRCRSADYTSRRLHRCSEAHLGQAPRTGFAYDGEVEGPARRDRCPCPASRHDASDPSPSDA
jgi:hypothetical protein